eukprot:TRINITY_DN92007_c0_g1_i1.p1 TRINITY_DN92007_c0_g1~~TRINITY_DN92007_c0_g1_i1.p1  ORF type:complete len:301 (-),score=38.22 TRINITY_DN92007_c0_g1_i1:212-1054(-)
MEVIEAKSKFMGPLSTCPVPVQVGQLQKPTILSTRPHAALHSLRVDTSLDAAPLLPKLRPSLHGEVESTDAGSSSGSEAESGYSSASESSQRPSTASSSQRLQSLQLRQDVQQVPACRPRERLGPLSRKVRLQSGQFFRGTPLTPIPGTPVGPRESMPADGCSSGPEDVKMGDINRRSELEPLSATELFGTPPGLPLSPQRRARHHLLEEAMAKKVPIKVSMPDWFTRQPSSLDCNLPAKKRPLWPTPPLAQQALDPRLPVKKRLPAFLLETPRIFAGTL